MMLTYNDTIMTEHQASRNRLREFRAARGWTQAELASQAGISRTAVTAIEGKSLVPSVAAALALARALETSVEVLFGGDASDRAAAWAWQPPSASGPFWEAEVNGRRWLYPAGSSPMLTMLPDGVASDEEPSTIAHASAARRTLVVACCDPAAGLLASEFARETGQRMLVLHRSSGKAIELLKQGKVHLAGLHFSTDDDPERNADVVRDTLGNDFRLVRVARWQEGIAAAPASQLRTVRGALRSKLRWVGREPGSGARQCLDKLLGSRRGPRHIAHHHRGVAEAVQSGWADAGVCVELTSVEAGLTFLPVQQEAYDICIPNALIDDPRIQAFLKVMRSVNYRRLLAGLPGYDTADTGTLYGLN